MSGSVGIVSEIQTVGIVTSFKAAFLVIDSGHDKRHSTLYELALNLLLRESEIVHIFENSLVLLTQYPERPPLWWASPPGMKRHAVVTDQSAGTLAWS